MAFYFNLFVIFIVSTCAFPDLLPPPQTLPLTSLLGCHHTFSSHLSQHWEHQEFIVLSHPWAGPRNSHLAIRELGRLFQLPNSSNVVLFHFYSTVWMLLSGSGHGVLLVTWSCITERSKRRIWHFLPFSWRTSTWKCQTISKASRKTQITKLCFFQSSQDEVSI